MTDFNWCHGPQCHEKHTVDRVRGVKGSKVLRTRKIKITNYNERYWFSYFCSQNCYDNFANKYIQQVIAIATTFTIKWFFMFSHVEGRS